MSKTELLDFTKEELVDIIYKSMCDKDNLIKYLEDKIKEPVSYNLLYDGKQKAYQDILERVKSGKYE